MIEIKKKHVKKVETKYIINSASWTVSFWCWPYEQVVLKNMEVENKTIPGPKWRPILLLKSMEAENIFLTLCDALFLLSQNVRYEEVRGTLAGQQSAHKPIKTN